MKINLQNAALEICAGSAAQFPSVSRPQLIFSGRSNVGKSSLINALLGRRALARVSAAPGKTITVNFYGIDGKAYFVDLPGYGFAKRSASDQARWSRLVDSFLCMQTNAPRLVLQLIDLKVGATADDEMMLEWLAQTGTPYVVVATKCDKLNKTERLKQLSALKAHPLIAEDTKIIPFSALKGEGKDAVLDEIFQFCK